MTDETRPPASWQEAEELEARGKPPVVHVAPPAPEPHVIPYNGNLDWLSRRTILYVVHGSRAYGTFRETSDYDYKGVTVPPRRYRDGFIHHFEQAEIKEPDAVIYGLQKFMALATDCNPNIIEVLWVEEKGRLICTPAGQLLVDNRANFLSQKAVYTFRGYAMAQLKRIRTHKKWLLDPPDHQPTRAEFNLPQRTLIPADQLEAAMAEVQKKLDGWEIDFGELLDSEVLHIQEQLHRYLAELDIGTDEKFQAAARLIGYDENFLVLLDRERHYAAAQRNWVQYQEWKATRNVARAALEAQHGYDTKHGMHLVRLLRMCREILTEGIVRVNRPDAAELKAIRDGAWDYERLIAWAEEQDSELLEVAKTSPLPKSPDRVALDQLCQEIVRSMQDD